MAEIDASPTRVSKWRPPARKWILCVTEFQPGLADARSEAAAKAALVAGVVEMDGNARRLGSSWGDREQPLVVWKGAGGMVDTNGVTKVDETGLPTCLVLSTINLRGPLSAQICRLTSLTHLDLYDNQLTALPDAIRGLTSLTGLHLAGNRLTNLPDAIGRLTSIIYLDLSDNQITALPNSIGRLTNLTSLDMYHNRLTDLPDVICRLTSLKNLNLSGNQFTVLPDTICRLTSLTRLSIYDNQLTVLPNAICHLKSLMNLNLSDNLFSDDEKRRIVVTSRRIKALRVVRI